MGLIEQAYSDAGLTESALSVLINVLPFQFYAILTLSAVLFFIITGRDFGPMGKAQQRFLTQDQYLLGQAAEPDHDLYF